LIPYFHRYKVPFLSGIGLLLFARVFEALIPICLMIAIDSLAQGEPYLMIPALGIVGCVILRFITIFLGRRAIRRVGIATIYDLRKRIFNHTQQQGPKFFARFSTGDLMSRAINDVGSIRMLIGFGIRSASVMFFSAIVGTSFMMYLSPSLTLWLFVPIPLIAVIAWWLSRQMFPKMILTREGLADLTSHVQENFNGIRTIQALAQENAEIGRFNGVNKEYASRMLSLAYTRSMLNAVMPALSALCTIVILGYGGSKVMSGELSLGAFAAFFSYLVMLMMPVRMLGMLISMFNMAAAGTQRVFEVLDYEPEIQDLPTTKTPQKITGHLDIQALNFTYPNTDAPILKNINLSIQAGEMIAITGRIGSGKSTLLKCLVRLVDTPAGHIRIDNHEVRDYPLAQLRKQVALVLQDPFLFSETLRLNLSYDDVSREEPLVWNAADAAHLKENILTFPEQMETLIGERGVNLSGGQKQRATLARGLIRETPVLLLDDCFASVDTETEERILTNLREMREGHTTLMVSHRVSTARHADRIIVLDEGRIAEIGSHDELLEKGGLYAALAEAQRSNEQAAARREALLQELS
ncbi:MAG: ABC transporter ATP-binding protein, partial [Pseudomonadota bacterium]